MASRLALLRADTTSVIYPTARPVITVSEIRNTLPTVYHTCSVVEKPISGISADKPDPYSDWNYAVAGGKSYLVGDTWTTERYLKRYSSPILPHWMRLAYTWAHQNPGCYLLIDSSHKNRQGFSVGGYTWHIGLRGDHVEYVLPHQDCGGEKCWMSRDGRTRLLVNED